MDNDVKTKMLKKWLFLFSYVSIFLVSLLSNHQFLSLFSSEPWLSQPFCHLSYGFKSVTAKIYYFCNPKVKVWYSYLPENLYHSPSKTHKIFRNSFFINQSENKITLQSFYWMHFYISALFSNPKCTSSLINSDF